MLISDYLNRVASYIEYEYGPDSDFEELSSDEKYAIREMLHAHFDLGSSINNAASDIIHYIRSNREWMRKIQNEKN